MVDLTEFFKEVKDRLTSPLFASFIISWLLWNWKVPISLFFDSEAVIKAEHYTSFVNYINKNVDNLHGLILPSISSILYILFYPPIRNLILGFITFNKTWGNNWNLYLSKSRKIPASKFLELKNKYNKQLQDLEILYSEESVVQRQNTSLKEEKIEIQKELIISQQNLSDTQTRLLEYKIPFDVSFVNGDWNANFVFGDNEESDFLELKTSKGVPNSSKFRIIMGEIFILNTDNFLSNNPIAKIINFYRNDKDREVSFIFKKGERIEFHEFRYNEEQTTFITKKQTVNTVVLNKILPKTTALITS